MVGAVKTVKHIHANDCTYRSICTVSGPSSEACYLQQAMKAAASQNSRYRRQTAAAYTRPEAVGVGGQLVLKDLLLLAALSSNLIACVLSVYDVILIPEPHRTAPHLPLKDRMPCMHSFIGRRYRRMTVWHGVLSCDPCIQR